MESSVRPGDVLLGKYRVERVLGKGGMGIVVAARHLELGELFAIKFLLPEALASPQAVERFLREARASARLKGEHVAKVHDVGKLESGAPYMVMEHLDGTDLRKLARARGPLPVVDAVGLMLQVCEAITEAHALGIVHRDLKPANLFLIRKPNGAPCLKVLDFGISKQVAQDTADLTKSGEILGTPRYMPPEQMLRMKDADPRSDLWAMGVILFELVTGSPPFPGDSMAEVVARILHDDPPPPSRLVPGVPGWLDAIVARCLQKRPEHRFQSAAELASALHFQGRRDSLPVDSSLGPPGSGRASQAHALAAHGLEPGPGPHEDATTVMIPSRAPPESAPRSSITASAWGRTGSGAKLGRSSGKIVAVVAGIAGLALCAIAASWLLGRPTPAAQ